MGLDDGLGQDSEPRYYGLTRLEWSGIAAMSLVMAGTAIALSRRRVSSNRRRGPRSNRLRRWGEK